MPQLPGLMSARAFSGCVGGVLVSGRPIGLFNFRQLSGSGCGSCGVPPVSFSTAESGTYQFDGSGYSSLPLPRYNPSNFHVAISFRTYWEEALLFVVHNPLTHDAVALELKGGYLVFTYKSRGVDITKVTTGEQYNTMDFVSID